MRSHLKDNWTSWLVLLAMIGLSLYLGGSLPERVATHFDLQGRPNDYSSKAFAMWLMPGVALLQLVLLPALLAISPKGYQMAHSRGSLARFMLAVTVLMASIHVGLLLGAAAPERWDVTTFIAGGMGLFLVLFGNVLGKSERNFVIGIRTPWSLVSDENWRATHRFAAKLMVAAGLAAFAALALGGGIVAVVALLMGSMLLPVAYSYLHYRRHGEA